MKKKKKEGELIFYDSFPLPIIVLRWILLSVFFGSGIYVLIQLNFVIALLWIFYCVAALAVVLPLSRCVHCYYFGKACNVGWGKVALWLFGRTQKTSQNSPELYAGGHIYSVLIYPFWLFPPLVAFMQLIRQRNLLSLTFLVGILLILLGERIFLKKICCKWCHQKQFCPAVPFRKQERS